MEGIEGKVAVVTGAASGIGLATAEELGRAGARVVLTDLDAEHGQAASERLRAAGAATWFFPADITDSASVEALAAAVLSEHGGVDIVVNVAGWTSIAPFLKTEPAVWQKLVEINYLGTLRVCHAFLPSMIGRGGGKIVNVASDAARVGSPNESVYAGAKGALVTFTKSLARETARHAVNVNCVCPGPTDTPMLATVRSEQEREALVRATPLRRLGSPEDVAGAIVFFCSSRANFITGQVLSVSGGLTMAG